VIFASVIRIGRPLEIPTSKISFCALRSDRAGVVLQGCGTQQPCVAYAASSKVLPPSRARRRANSSRPVRISVEALRRMSCRSGGSCTPKERRWHGRLRPRRPTGQRRPGYIRLPSRSRLRRPPPTCRNLVLVQHADSPHHTQCPHAASYLRSVAAIKPEAGPVTMRPRARSLRLGRLNRWAAPSGFGRLGSYDPSVSSHA
jgi:hypothetical protein